MRRPAVEFIVINKLESYDQSKRQTKNPEKRMATFFSTITQPNINNSNTESL